jgi:hypothetical protein
MPYLNKYGEWCAGIGSVGVSWGSVTGIGTVIWPTGGGAHWLDDDTVIAQNCPGGVCGIWSYNVRLSSEVLISDKGANDLSAKSGVWAAWLGGNPAYGVFSSTGKLLPKAGLSVTSVGSDGSIAIKRSYQGIGNWDVHEMTGAVWLLTGGDASSIHLLGSRKASWIEGGFPKVTDLVPRPNPRATPIYWLRMLETPNGWWCLYNVGNDTVLHPVASAEGYIVAQGNAFQPDLMLYAPNVIRVVYSLTAGERPEDIVVLDVDLAAPRIVVASSPLPFVPGLPPPSSISVGGPGILSPRQRIPIVPSGSMLMTSMGEFGVAGLSEELLVAPDEVFPTFPVETGKGRLVHPSLGMYEYEVKPDEWVNIDADAIVPPVWASSRTLTGAANVLWPGNLRDVVVEERWKGEGGISMPIEQLRMLLSFWTTQPDPEEAYVEWYPTYITRVSFKVLLIGLTAGGQNIVLDDVVNYRDLRGPDGWVTAPVVLQLRLVGRL